MPGDDRMATFQSPDPFGYSVVQAVREALETLPFSDRIPSVHQLSVLLNTCFWASLRTEEGQNARVAIAVADWQEDLIDGLILNQPLPCSSDVLVKLSPILRANDAHLLVDLPKRAAPRIWGISQRPLATISVRTVAPGHVAVYDSVDSLVAYLPAGKAPRIIGFGALNIPDWTLQIVAFLGGEGLSGDDKFRIAGNLRHIAKAMQHGRGGTLLLVPIKDESWKQSLDIKYKIKNDQLDLERRYQQWRQASEEESKRIDEQLKLTGPHITYMAIDTLEERAFRRAAALLGTLTAVDGATVTSTDFTLIGFGAKIIPRGEPPATVQISDPLEGVDSNEVPFSNFSGTRHQSAVQFVNDNPGAFGLVASQDGYMTFVVGQYGVRAFRVEALLL